MPATKSGFLGSHGGRDTALEPHQLGEQPCLPLSLALVSGEPLTLSEPLPLTCQQSAARLKSDVKQHWHQAPQKLSPAPTLSFQPSNRACHYLRIW